MTLEEKPFDTTRKFVRVTELRENGLVEFEFAIGEPELFVELIMAAPAFDEFCAANKVTFIDDKGRLKLGDEDAEWRWSLRDATHQRFK